MECKFTVETGQAERYVATVSVKFSSGSQAGKTITGFRVYRAPEGSFYVTLPNRLVGKGDSRRYVDSVTFDNAGETLSVKRWILSEATVLGFTR